eukprot:TRINITY_DN19582_c1_g1_i2.p1 TRINITY_DN19582_c1_g1~~TRINITY_DN19582_c1_g1_i2.p1  ORF type:complete len:578 (-),score=92.64 TRINITY_DN19582_c1_g1_i2:196-1929(-)
MPASVVPVDVFNVIPDKQKHGWQDANCEDLEANVSVLEDAWGCARIRGVLAQIDLRFHGDRLAEDAFAESLEPDVLKSGFWVSLAGAVLIPCALIPVVVCESKSTQNPLQIQNWDIRSSLFLIWTSTFMITASYCVTSCLRMWKNWFRNWNWELYFLMVAMYYIVSLSLANFWHMPFLAGSHPSKVWQHDAHGSEVFVLLAIDGLLTAVAMYVPVRTCMLWILPLVGVGSHFIVLVLADSMLPNDRNLRIGVLLLLAFFSQHCAVRDETRRRQNWQALALVSKTEKMVKQTEEVVKEQTIQIQDNSALVRGLQDVIGCLCEFLLFLTDDLRIQSAEKAHKAFFEQDIEGFHFTDFLQESDIGRFESFIKLVASDDNRKQACLPVTVKRASTTSICHLLVVDTGTTREPRYLMGVRVEREDMHTPVMSQEFFPTQEPLASASEAADEAQQLGLVRPVGVGAQAISSWGSSAANDTDISFSTYPKGDISPSPHSTPISTMALALIRLMPRWNVRRDSHSCCQFHTVVCALPSVLQYLERQECDPLWSNIGPGQCEACWSMCLEDCQKCTVCSDENPELQ